MAVGYHVCFRAEDERVLATSSAERRAFATALKTAGRDRGLYAFGLADRHGHAVLHGADAPVAVFLRAASLKLGAALAVRVVGKVLREIRDGFHEEDLVAYVHGQDVHHGTGLDPLREATSLPDLFGLRPDGLWLADRLRVVAPALTRRDLLAQWGLADLGERDGLAHLADAGAAAVGRATLDGNRPEVVAARIACIAAAGPGAPTSVLATTLGITERTVQRLRAAPVDAALLRAVRRQLDLRARLPPAALPFDTDRAGRKRRR